MLTKEALVHLSMSHSIIEASSEIAHATEQNRGFVILPETFTKIDIEHLSAVGRVRARGIMNTTDIESFVAYVITRSDPGATVFIDAQTMTAKAVLNLGTIDHPGHADDVSCLRMAPTAAFTALLKACRAPLSQADAAEFLEDWAPYINCLGDDELVIPAKHAIAAIRRITVEELRAVESEQQSLSAQQSTFDSIKASSKGGQIPVSIQFFTAPYLKLQQRQFSVRLSVLTGGKAPTIQMRIALMQQHEEEMARELQQILAGSITKQSVVVGTYDPRP